MKMFFFRSSVAPNFGDELNPWLWPKLLDGMFDDDEREIFIGIGSILWDDYPKASLKIVMGAGYGGYKPPPIIDENWQVNFVRGPQTAEHLGLPPKAAITDSAVLLRTVFRPQSGKRYRASFIPHWESLYGARWDLVCAMAGIHLIDPRQPVETVLSEIAASEVVIAEAMHGAISADALRVPWIPVMPFVATHRFKWLDWSRSLDLELRPVRLMASTFAEWRQASERPVVASVEPNDLGQAGATLRGRLKAAAKGPASAVLRVGAAAALYKASRMEPMLSRDSKISEVTDRALECVSTFREQRRGVLGSRVTRSNLSHAPGSARHELAG